MNTQTDTKTESRSGENNGAPASIVWFEIPVDNVERAKTFYGKLFDWKIERFPGPKPTGTSIPAAPMRRSTGE